MAVLCEAYKNANKKCLSVVPGTVVTLKKTGIDMTSRPIKT